MTKNMTFLKKKTCFFNVRTNYLVRSLPCTLNKGDFKEIIALGMFSALYYFFQIINASSSLRHKGFISMLKIRKVIIEIIKKSV